MNRLLQAGIPAFPAFGAGTAGTQGFFVQSLPQFQDYLQDIPYPLSFPFRNPEIINEIIQVR